MREDPEKQRTGKGAPHLGVLGQSNCGDSHLPAHHQHAACQHSFGLGQKSSHCPVLPALISASVPIPCLQQNGEAPTRPPRSFTTFQGGPALLDDVAVSVMPSCPSSETACAHFPVGIKRRLGSCASQNTLEIQRRCCLS